MVKIKPVIMAGGLGTRLWPLSSNNLPKQFIKLDEGYSLLQKTLLRNKEFGTPTIITNINYRQIVLSQIREIGLEADIIIEPCQKNTTSCAIIAALLAQHENYDYVLLLPSDHIIYKVEEYKSDIKTSFKYASNNVVAIGITPDGPHTGYGYIKINTILDKNIYTTKKFTEKPDLKTAKEYLQQGDYFWNSGIYIYNPMNFLKHAKSLQPLMLKNLTLSLEHAKLNQNCLELNSKFFEAVNAISLDYAIIEQISDLIMLKAQFYWQDLGSWSSLLDNSDKDVNGNYIKGEVTICDVKNSYINSKDKKVIILGLEEIIVVNNEEGIFIASKSHSQNLTKLLENEKNKLVQSKKLENIN
jgi:mannose-1-phosphate guanylyltransferase